MRLSMNRRNEASRAERRTDYRFKILYAVGIILVVSGHCYGGSISLFKEFFPPYLFHLALFAFSSGYFYKSESEEAVGAYIVKKLKRLIVPYYAWNLVYALLANILKFAGFTMGSSITLFNFFIMPITNGHQFIYNLAGWFVFPLFFIECANVILRRIIWFYKGHLKEPFFFTAYFLLGVLGILLANAGYRNGFWLALVRSLYLLPFFGMGIFYKRVLEKYDTISNIVYFSVVLFSQLLIIFLIGRVPAYTPSWCHDFVDGPIVPFLSGYLAIAFWLRISRILEPAIGNSKIINLISDNTYAIMMHHLMAFMVVKTMFGIIAKTTPFFSDFGYLAYKTNIWYYYRPNYVDQFLLLYVVAGIALPIIFQIIWNSIKQKLKNQYQNIAHQKMLGK